MNLSQNGLNLIKKFEGVRLKAYKPVESEKYYTIGFGHYGPDVRSNETITEKQAEDYLKHDLELFVDGVNHLVKVPINQNQADALYSLAYNIGLNNFKSSTLLQCVNAKNFSGAIHEFGKWIHDGGKVLQGLVNRRNEEAKLFSTPFKCPCCGK